MASTVVAAILALSDRMSPKLLECGRNWDKLSKAEQRAAKSSASTVHGWMKQIDKATTKALKFGCYDSSCGGSSDKNRICRSV